MRQMIRWDADDPLCWPQKGESQKGKKKFKQKDLNHIWLTKGPNREEMFCSQKHLFPVVF